MPVDVRVPVLGESVVEATVGAWLKHEGEPVEAGEALVQLETEKVNVDVAADQSGVLGKIAAREGETVHPGESRGAGRLGGSSECASARSSAGRQRDSHQCQRDGTATRLACRPPHG